MSWTVTDPDTGVSAMNGCAPQTFGADTPSSGITVTCGAANGKGLSATATTTVRIDRTPPKITGARQPEANSAGWNNTNVTVTFTCADTLSGIASCSPRSEVVGTEGAGQSRSASAVDAAGNVASAVVGSINIDKTAPELFYQFTTSKKDIAVYARDAASGASGSALKPVSIRFAHWGDANAGSDKEVVHKGHDKCRRREHTAEERIYQIGDRAGNTLRASIVVKRIGKQLRARITSLHYAGRATAVIGNSISVDWSTRGSTVTRLTQHVWMTRGKKKEHIQVDFPGGRYSTIVDSRAPGRKTRYSGIPLLKIATQQGSIQLEGLPKR